MTLWSEGFRSNYPNVRIEIEGKGSSTAPPALIESTSQFGPMSRAMKPKEEDDFEKKHGYKPSKFRAAVDSLAVFVHKDAPISCLTSQQIDAIFSMNRKLGHTKDITTWGDLGAKGEWASKPISIFGRNSASGTYGYFKEVALAKGDFKNSVKEQPGSSAVVQGVASDKYAIGYSGIGYKTPDVKAISIASKEGEKCSDASMENAYNGSYPLARFLYVYLNKKPNQDLAPITREFIKYVLSKEGQLVTIKDGYYPLSAALAKQDLEALGIKEVGAH
jgi:phosphate transport system substrate-binding protein